MKQKQLTIKNKEIERECFKFADCDLFPDSDKSYLGATTDQLVVCKCCGNGWLEIKCRDSIRHTKPTKDYLNYVLWMIHTHLK